ncbi:MAG: hypothetical protein QF807_08005 [Candidatus Thalassarchaeaceae archaeon]|jgi:hypothetical protein|nr:hypothetical protein [Candidatus Thalassarchaeaceae archaeon]
MAEDEKNLAEGDDFFTSQMNFDLESKPSRKRRRRRKGGEKPRASPIQLKNAELRKEPSKSTKLDHKEIPVQADEISQCPGCGTEVNEGEFVETIISFVTGATDYLAGNPVRTQTIHNLKQQAKALDMPEPYEDWLLEVCARIEAQIHRSVNLHQEEIRNQMEENLRRELIGELYEHIQNEIGARIRQEVENEMWEQFEEMYRERKDQVE